MPATTPCVHCGAVGNVRWERVITGTVVVVDYYCGRCDHEWRLREGDERRETPHPTPIDDELNHVRPGDSAGSRTSTPRHRRKP